MVHGKPGRNSSLVFAFGPAEQIEVSAFAHAQHDHLYILTHDVGDHVVHQIQAFLIAQTTHHADHRHIVPHVQPQLFLQLLFTGRFALQMIHAEVFRNQLVRLRVVSFHVNAVQHAFQVCLACAEESVQSFAVVGSLNFFRIGRTDGRNQIRIHQCSLHEVGASETFQLVFGPKAVTQSQDVLHLPDSENALILKVVNRENGADPGVERQMGILDFQQCRNHTALPVVAVNYVRLEIHQRQHIQRPAAEESEPFVFVPAHAVDIRPREVVFIVHEIPLHAVHFDLFNPAVLAPPSQLDFKIAYMGHLFRVFARNLTEVRNQHPDVVPFLCQYRCKRTNHVGQAARFDKRNCFTGYKQNFQIDSLLKCFR